MLECSSAVCDGWCNIVYNKAASFVSVSGGEVETPLILSPVGSWLPENQNKNNASFYYF